MFRVPMLWRSILPCLCCAALHAQACKQQKKELALDKSAQAHSCECCERMHIHLIAGLG